MADGRGPEHAGPIRRPGRLRGLRALAAKLADRVIILPYLGYGTEKRLVIAGRVLQYDG